MRRHRRAGARSWDAFRREVLRKLLPLSYDTKMITTVNRCSGLGCGHPAFWFEPPSFPVGVRSHFVFGFQLDPADIILSSTFFFVAWTVTALRTTCT